MLTEPASTSLLVTVSRSVRNAVGSCYWVAGVVSQLQSMLGTSQTGDNLDLISKPSVRCQCE